MAKPSNGQNTTREQRSRKKQISSEGIEFIRRTVQLHKCLELSNYYRLQTFQEMLNTPDIFTCYDHRATMLEKSQPRGYFEYNPNSAESVKAKRFLEHNMRNLDDNQTARSISRQIATMIKNEWSPFEFVSEKTSLAEWKGDPLTQFKLKKLAFIDPLTLDRIEPFRVEVGGDRISHLRQRQDVTIGSGSAYNTSGTATFSQLYTANGINEIAFNRVVYCGSKYPKGESCFDAAYVAWREILLLNEYATIGVTRDFSGTPVLRLPSDLLSKHAQPDDYPQEYALVENLKESLECMEAGEQTFMILPSDLAANSSTKPMHDISFLGIEGGGKNYNIETLIEQRRKTIFNVFGCQHLLSAEGSGGSYNQHQGLENTSSHYVHRDMDILEEFYNKQVFPKLFRLNGWDISEEDMPKWKSGPIQDITHDEYGKFVNRVARLLPAKPEVQNKLLEKLGIDYRVDPVMSTEEIREDLFEFKEPSKVGSGEGSSGTGNSQEGGKSSDTNDENKA